SSGMAAFSSRTLLIRRSIHRLMLPSRPGVHRLWASMRAVYSLAALARSASRLRSSSVSFSIKARCFGLGATFGSSVSGTRFRRSSLPVWAVMVSIIAGDPSLYGVFNLLLHLLLYRRGG